MIVYKTRIDAFEKCPRYGYLKYHAFGKGIEQPFKSISLALGSAMHEGIHELWRGHSVDAATIQALVSYGEEVSAGLLMGRKDEDAVKIRTDHELLLQALLHLWSRTRLPVLKKDYSFVEGEYRIITPIHDQMDILAVPDAILKANLDGRFVNWSLKTEKSHNRIKHPSALIDTGGITEAIVLAATVGDGLFRNIAGTMMEYIVVGDVAENEPIVWHPAIRGWTKGGEIAWRYKYDNPEYDPYGPKSPRKNPKQISIGKGWKRITATEYGGVKKWTEDLVARKFAPYHLDPLNEIFFVPPMYSRPVNAIADFLDEKIPEHLRYAEGLKLLEEAEPGGDRTPKQILAEYFPRRRCNCLRYGMQYRCEMWSICHEGLQNPLTNGFVPRLNSEERLIAKEQKRKEEYEKTISQTGL